MGLQLTGRRVIVTGGSRGIGAAYVRAFLDQGAKVAIADIVEPDGHQLGEDLIFHRTDVTEEVETARAVETVRDSFGGVDVLINNAAVYQDIGRKLPFDEISTDDWDQVMRVNVRGVWQCTKAVAPTFRDQRYGKVVNVASTVAFIGSVGFAHYVASKAAVIGLTRALARELGPSNVTVNAVAPGLVTNDATRVMNDETYVEKAASTRSIPRQMRPDDLVGTVLYLSSPASDFVSGQTFVVDGGHILN
jgi:NAD(P)-dependent dehydrogenase (short-subunit alcohol dehydrogenase family)